MNSNRRRAIRLSIVLFLGTLSSVAPAFADICLPPPGGNTYTGGFHQWGAVVLTQPQHSQFVQCFPPPPPIPGAMTDEIFDSKIQGTLFFNGVLQGDIFADATTRVKVTFDQAVGNTRFFDTEMLQLDISGGNLPPGVLIRESPTLASTGKTTVTGLGATPFDGPFEVTSFFDVFTELSLDNGQSWIPSVGSTRMTLVPEPGSISLLGTVLVVVGWGFLRLRHKKAQS